ncbi:hypothetical protein GQ457_13G011180 [Hibiscus cannabinus]
MENPSENLGEDCSKLSESHGGQPPDNAPAPSEFLHVLNGIPLLERHGSPLPTEVMPMSKRGRLETDNLTSGMEDGTQLGDFFDTTMGDADTANPTGTVAAPAMNVHMNLNQGVQENGQPKLSFRDTLVGKNGLQPLEHTIKELDVVVTDEDVLYGGNNLLPEIRFSDRVHDVIDEKLAHSVIIRLLGKSIGYRALLNRIQTLWNPIGELQLIDLDNEYFLVRFAVEEDFAHVLTGGSWVVYGSYLTVQPWSRNFSTNVDHPEKIMVWVRLPKLPYRYYTKSLFRYIANAIGKVIRIDYNIEDGRRGRFTRLVVIVDLNKPLVSGIVIDGIRQEIEYEGLPSICFACGKYGHSKDVCGQEFSRDTPANGKEVRDPKELYGPWMQVANRRGRVVESRKNSNVHNTRIRVTENRGSRFTILQDPKEVELEFEQAVNCIETHTPIESRDRPSNLMPRGKDPIVTTGNGEGCSKSADKHDDIENSYKAHRMHIDLDDDIHRLDGEEITELEMGSVKEVAPNDIINVAETTLNKVNHTAIKIATALKGGQRHGSKVKKKDDRGPAKPVLEARISALTSELDKAEAAEVERRKGNQGGGIQWHENGVFNRPRDNLGQLVSACIGPVNPPPTKVTDMVDRYGFWDWNRMNQWFPQAALEMIAAAKPPRHGLGADVPGWRWEKNHSFSVRSAYKALVTSANVNGNAYWSKLWKIPVPQRVRVFMWLVFHQRIMTNVERTRRHLASSDLCVICCTEAETIEHALRSCSKARQAWESVVRPAKISTFLSLPFTDWILQCVTDVAGIGVGDDRWAARFSIFCWLIWKERCNIVFNHNVNHGSSWIRYGNQLVDAWSGTHYCGNTTGNCNNVPNSRSILAWQPPNVGWVKANCDGAVNPRNDTATIEGVIRDESGVWIFGFTRRIGRCSVLTAELWAIHDMLNHAWNIGLRNEKSGFIHGSNAVEVPGPDTALRMLLLEESQCDEEQVSSWMECLEAVMNEITREKKN